MFQEGYGEFEYCFFEQSLQAADTVLWCESQDSRLLDPSLLNGTETLVYVYELVRANQEFWVDLTDEDLK